MLSPERSSHRNVGFSLLEVIAAIAIMAILAAVVVPMTSGSNVASVNATKVLLDTIRLANAKFITATANNMGALHLMADVTRIGETSTCDGTEPGGNVTLYVASDSSGWTGPYYIESVSPTGGWPVPIGVLDDRVKRNYAANGSVANTVQGAAIAGGSSTPAIFVTMREVKLEDAEALNVLFDPVNEVTNADRSNNRGSIRWLAPDASLNVVLNYLWSSTIIAC